MIGRPRRLTSGVTDTGVGQQKTWDLGLSSTIIVADGGGSSRVHESPSQPPAVGPTTVTKRARVHPRYDEDTTGAGAPAPTLSPLRRRPSFTRKATPTTGSSVVARIPQLRRPRTGAPPRAPADPAGVVHGPHRRGRNTKKPHRCQHRFGRAMAQGQHAGAPQTRSNPTHDRYTCCSPNGGTHDQSTTSNAHANKANTAPTPERLCAVFPAPVGHRTPLGGIGPRPSGAQALVVIVHPTLQPALQYVSMSVQTDDTRQVCNLAR